VTPENRARSGEIIHLYMTGLGPVDPPVETEAPSPSNPPARLRLPLSCRFAGDDRFMTEQAADILFAGLAPGFAGYYQVTIRIPDDLYTRDGDALIGCGFVNPASGGYAWIPIEKE
jgi:uncharacterized protein (TIGR03437 family)